MSRNPAEFSPWSEALPRTYGPYAGVVRHIVDGDTFDLLIDLGWNIYSYHPVRLLGVNTPESNRAVSREAGLAAKRFVEGIMPTGTQVLVRPLPDPDSFGRYLAAITLPDGHDLATEIIAAGQGVVYP